MANIKISELNELLPGQKAYDDYLPIVDSSANETKKVSVKNLIPNNVELIAVTDTAPTSFGTGDKYYNTTTNRIYTARSGEWISPEEPIKGILYVILEDQKTFTYDEYNETLVSVGGGGGGGIAVYPDEPEEDTKIYIEEEDLDGQYLPVEEDIYSTTETKTNKIWIDGSQIYRKVVSGSTLSSGLNTFQLFNDANQRVINMQGVLRTNDGVVFMLPDINSSFDVQTIMYVSQNQYLNINIRRGVSNINYYAVVVEYTKTN